MNEFDPETPFTISQTPVRKVIKRNSQRGDGYFNSRKMGTSLPRESKGERAFLVLAELDPRVSEIYAQPCKLTHRSRNGPSVAYPDFAITIDGRTEIHEVKEEADYADPEVHEKLYWVGREFAYKDIPYSVTISETIKPLALSDPIGDLLRRLYTRVPNLISLATPRILADGPLPIGMLMERLPSGTSFQHIEAMVAQGDLRADLLTPLSREVEVHSAESGVFFARLIPFNPPTRPALLPRSFG
jgi:hypothetical protein